MGKILKDIWETLSSQHISILLGFFGVFAGFGLKFFASKSHSKYSIEITNKDGEKMIIRDVKKDEASEKITEAANILDKNKNAAT